MKTAACDPGYHPALSVTNGSAHTRQARAAKAAAYSVNTAATSQTRLLPISSGEDARRPASASTSASGQTLAESQYRVRHALADDPLQLATAILQLATAMSLVTLGPA